ncbi:unnamed protein product [Anisakis simplex]|uniref:Complex1_LYR_dom domain-containing protein n=1 Tax=Anisakis simplex TaxID=6269 RepID=A0A0M3JSF8_ANISI|nr:unnamed protein product [Anisakis simplex]
MAAVSREAWIKLYKDLQNAAAKFPQYYYREFFQRRIHDHFGVFSANGRMPEPSQYKKAEELLHTLQRQAAVSSLYPAPKLVIEKESLTKGFR